MIIYCFFSPFIMLFRFWWCFSFGIDDEDVDPKSLDLPQRDKIYLATDTKFEQKYDSLQELGK